MPEFPSFDAALSASADVRCWRVAFSGGLDSTALLHLVLQWCQSHEDAPELEAWHINHGMQADADAWEDHCRTLCADWGVPIRVDRVAVVPDGEGAEAAARDARYGAFAAQLAADEQLLLAHHQDDQVETFFLRLMRGAGLQGLSGMPSQRSLGDGSLLRPLLEIERGALQRYVSALGLMYIEDPSNRDSSLDRNFLRTQVLPLLGQRWGGYRQTVTRAAAHLAAGLDTLGRQLPAPDTVRSRMGDPGVSLDSLVLAEPDIASLQLRALLRKWGLAMPGQASLLEFLRQLREGGDSAAPKLEASDYSLQRFGDAVYLLPLEEGVAPGASVQLVPGEVNEVPGVGSIGLVPADGAGFALAEGEVLSIQWRSGGERCQPAGRGNSLPLKKLLQEGAIPPWWRDRIPLLVLGDEILAVADFWLCDSSRLQSPVEDGNTLWRLRWQRNTFDPVD